MQGCFLEFLILELSDVAIKFKRIILLKLDVFRI